ncbi:MAG: heme lyase CcmF/NrfE family subunit [Acidobacteriota bacterium]
MAEVGFYLLLVALGIAALATVASLAGGLLHSPSLVESGARSLIVLSLLLTFIIFLLARLFWLDDVSVRYVAEHSSSSTPPLYKVTALWGGQAGSLLLWVWVQSLYAGVLALAHRKQDRHLMPFVQAVLGGISAFFLVTVCFAANPFLRTLQAPADGVGLNPLLQNPMMAIHPPTLYLGYVGFSVPFAFAIAALASGNLDDRWIRTTRRWTLFTWFVLGTGILLGSWWAYLELGWGGYWAWDPVENASLMPWLCGTAFLHSAVIQERRRMLKIWNIVLIAAAFSLSILGTFITRSGIISSVHSFAQSEVGYFFLFFLIAIICGTLALLLYRLPELHAKTRIESIVSRESAFLFNNVLFTGMVFAVLWGTLFPILSEWVRGTKISVTQTWFNTFNVPLGLAILVLMGLGPLLAWRRSTGRYFLRNFRVPVAITVLSSLILVGLGLRSPLAVISFTFCVFVVACTGLEFYRGMRSRIRMYSENVATALFRLVDSNKRRWGGYVVHIGMVLIFAGITGSSAFQKETTQILAPGESFTIGPYQVTFRQVDFHSTPRAETYLARLDLRRHGRALPGLVPGKEFFPSFRNQPASEVAIHHAFSEDLYLVLLSTTDDGRATIKAYLNPLVSWIWFGGIVLLLGGVVTMMPDPRQRQFAARIAQEENRVAA